MMMPNNSSPDAWRSQPDGVGVTAVCKVGKRALGLIGECVVWSKR